MRHFELRELALMELNEQTARIIFTNSFPICQQNCDQDMDHWWQIVEIDRLDLS